MVPVPPVIITNMTGDDSKVVQDRPLQNMPLGHADSKTANTRKTLSSSFFYCKAGNKIPIRKLSSLYQKKK